MKEKLISLLKNNLHDICIVSGLVIFILTMFLFKSLYAGFLTLSFSLLGVGVLLAMIN